MITITLILFKYAENRPDKEKSTDTAKTKNHISTE